MIDFIVGYLLGKISGSGPSEKNVPVIYETDAEYCREMLFFSGVVAVTCLFITACILDDSIICKKDGTGKLVQSVEWTDFLMGSLFVWAIGSLFVGVFLETYFGIKSGMILK